MYSNLTATMMKADYAAAFDAIQRAMDRTPREFAYQFAIDRGIPFYQFFGKTRVHKVAHQRQECWASIRREFHISFPSIGRIFGRDHTTVQAGIRRHEARAVQ